MPPGAAIATASSHASGRPTASITRSAPRAGELAHARDVRRAALGLDCRRRRSARAAASRSRVRVEHDRLRAGGWRASAASISPSEPAPRIATRSPGERRRRRARAPRRPAARPAARARAGRPSGSRCRFVRDDALGDEQLLGEAAEQVEQVLAQALAAARGTGGRRRTAPSRRRTPRRRARTRRPRPTDSTTPANSWPEPGRVRAERRVPARDALDVGAAGRGRADRQHDLAGPGDGLGRRPRSAGRPGRAAARPSRAVTITLMPSRLRAAASASPVCSSGKRCVISALGARPRRRRSARAPRACRAGRPSSWPGSRARLKKSSSTSKSRPLARAGGGEELDHGALVGALRARAPRPRRAPVASMTTVGCAEVRRSGVDAARRRAPSRARGASGSGSATVTSRAAGERRLGEQQAHLAAADHEQPRVGVHARAVAARGRSRPAARSASRRRR